MSKNAPLPVDPAEWPRPSGYANGMAGSGRVLAVAGQIGWEPSTRKLASGEFVPQVRQALRNVLTVVESAGGSAENILRLTWYITDHEAYVGSLPQIGEVYREVMGRHFPAMSVVVVAGLIERQAKVEIEATALLTEA